MTTSGRLGKAYIPDVNLLVNESWNDWLVEVAGLYWPVLQSV